MANLSLSSPPILQKTKDKKLDFFNFEIFPSVFSYAVTFFPKLRAAQLLVSSSLVPPHPESRFPFFGFSSIYVCVVVQNLITPPPHTQNTRI